VTKKTTDSGDWFENSLIFTCPEAGKQKTVSNKINNTTNLNINLIPLRITFPIFNLDSPSPLLPFSPSPAHFFNSLTISVAILPEAPAGPSVFLRTS
jgi:hypothetical protein